MLIFFRLTCPELWRISRDLSTLLFRKIFNNFTFCLVFQRIGGRRHLFYIRNRTFSFSCRVSFNKRLDRSFCESVTSREEVGKFSIGPGQILAISYQSYFLFIQTKLKLRVTYNWPLTRQQVLKNDWMLNLLQANPNSKFSRRLRTLLMAINGVLAEANSRK